MTYWRSNPVRGIWHAGLLGYEQKNVRVTTLNLLNLHGIVSEKSGQDNGSCCKSTDGSFSCTLHPDLSPEEFERTCLYHLAHIRLGHLKLPLLDRFGFSGWLMAREADVFVFFYPYFLRLFRGEVDSRTVLHFALASFTGVTTCEVCGQLDLGSFARLCREMI